MLIGHIASTGGKSKDAKTLGAGGENALPFGDGQQRSATRRSEAQPVKQHGQEDRTVSASTAMAHICSEGHGTPQTGGVGRRGHYRSRRFWRTCCHRNAQIVAQSRNSRYSTQYQAHRLALGLCRGALGRPLAGPGAHTTHLRLRPGESARASRLVK